MCCCEYKYLMLCSSGDGSCATPGISHGEPHSQWDDHKGQQWWQQAEEETELQKRGDEAAQ